jgi:hypothetical protein
MIWLKVHSLISEVSMLIKVQYSGGYSTVVDSQFLSSIDSLGEYVSAQFQGDEYSLNCEFVEISFLPANQLSQCL